MRNFLVSLFIILFSFGYAQELPTNRFDELETSDKTVYDSPAESPPEMESLNGGNPADPTPIDDYIPLLIIAAVGIIVYKSYTKNKALS